MYETAIETAKRYLFFRPLNPQNQDLLVSGTVRKNAADNIKLNPQGQHLACFTGGMVGLASKIFDRPNDLEIARKLVDGCIWAYESMPTGIAPELFSLVPCKDPSDCKWSRMRWYSEILDQSGKNGGFGQDVLTERAEQLIRERGLVEGFTDISDRRFLLRPEAIESIFILYRITGDVSLQDTAWRMFEAVRNHTKTGIGNAGISDVTVEEPEQLDVCESFWMAETLKYFYLIFEEPDVISLDDYVFNTEAHPLKRPKG
jgi:mannosyl-oligosaccharide alpha-1,2-mannosidase